MNAPDRERPERLERLEYHEPAQTYRSAWALFGALLIGFGADLALGHGGQHLWAWLLAVVLVVGIDVLVTRAARTMRSITLTRTDLRVGEDAVPRAEILGRVAGADIDPSLRVLGLTRGAGLPRGVPGLAVRLRGGEVVAVPTRRPDRLAAALEVAAEVPAVRPAEPEELAEIPEIEQRAESLFRVAGMDLPPGWTTVDELREAQAVFVVGTPAVGVVRIEEFDGLAHVELLAVIPGQMRRGLGSALLEAACSWAAARGYRAITLITFADVAWNGPFYAARGFVEVDDVTPELAELRDWERAVGLDSFGRRVVMRREL